MKKALKKANGQISFRDNKVGWKFLSELCKLRGFDELPEQLEDKDFDDLVAKDGNYLIQRGICGNQAHDFIREFSEKEECYYGTEGMYGAGIYGAINKAKKNPPPPNPDYEIAHGYSGHHKDQIIDICLPSTAKIIDAKELDAMMYEEFFGKDFGDKQREYNDLKTLANEKDDYANNIEKIIEEETRKEMGYDKKVLDSLNNRPEEYFADPNKASFNRAVKYYSTIVNRLGGKVNKVNEKTYEVSLPHSTETFNINLGIAERSANKQKNVSTSAYNLHYRYLRDFIIENHFKKITEKTINIAKNDIRIIEAHKEAKEANTKLRKVADEINDIRVNGGKNNNLSSVMLEIAKHPEGTYRGFYGAIKGYDVIIDNSTWGGSTSFAVILNRSVVKTRKLK